MRIDLDEFEVCSACPCYNELLNMGKIGGDGGCCGLGFDLDVTGESLKRPQECIEKHEK